MKKNLLLTMAFATVITSTAVAMQPIEKSEVNYRAMPRNFVSGYVNANSDIREKNPAAKASSPTETSTTTFSYCSDPETALTFFEQSKGDIIRLGAEINKETAQKLAGTTITAINVGGGTNNDNTANPATKVKVFLTYDFKGEPFYYQDATLSSEALAWNKVVLNKPYTIEADKPFYYGYEITVDDVHLSNDCYYVVIDGITNDNLEGGWSLFKFNGQTEMQSLSPIYGDVCTSIDITGSNLPTAYGSIVEVRAPITATAGVEIPFKVRIKNEGAGEIKKGEIEVRANNGAPQTIPFDFGTKSIKYNEEKQFSAKCVINETGSDVKFTVTLSKINDEVNKTDNGTQTVDKTLNVLPEGKGFKRTVVIEEGTGTWCGYCPAGIVLLEHARKTYTDGSMICIAVHSGDEMEAINYAPFIDEYIARFPRYVVNRYQLTGLTSTSDYNDLVLKMLYDELRAAPASAKINLSAKFTDARKKSIDCYSETTTCINTKNSLLRVAYVIVEDQVGPYDQTNYFINDDSVDGWENCGDPREWTYNDVAREIINWDGIYESLPVEMTAEKVYNHTQTINIPEGVNPDNCRVVAMLVNTENGTIENAIQTNIDAPGAVEAVIGNNEAVSISGVNGAIVIEGNYAEAIVYNLDGTTATVANGANMIAISAGLYIVKVDNVVKKIFVH